MSPLSMFQLKHLLADTCLAMTKQKRGVSLPSIPGKKHVRDFAKIVCSIELYGYSNELYPRID